MAEKDIQLKQVLKRFPPGDRWTPTNAEQPVFSSLTEGIEYVFQKWKRKRNRNENERTKKRKRKPRKRSPNGEKY